MNPTHLAAHGDSAGLWDWNLAANRIHFSPRWISLLGCDERDVGNTPEAWLRRVHPDDISRVQAALDGHLTGGPGEFDIPHRLLHRDGTYRWTSCHGVVVRNEAGEAVRVMGCHSDVTADKVADALTGLPNRLLFMDHLARAIERARRNPTHHFAVLLLELDRPGQRGEYAEPPAADPLLTSAARRLETALRAGADGPGPKRDHLVARLRGDEFAVLLDGLEEVGDARTTADRILAELLFPFTLGGAEVYAVPSIGIAVSATGYTRAEDVLRDADTALYRAKQLGRARCEIFDTAIVRSAQTERQLEGDFKDALDRREFLLYFQPVVALATNRIAGFEALVRWQHPARGLISPSEFIPIAERTGFIVPLGRWIVREACLQLKAWQESVPDAKDVWVSFNLSAPQFNDRTLVDDIAAALHDASLDARCLVLELTEGVAMESPAAVKSLLMRLRVMGARVALDDFGTGQSSLAYLHQFPADLLKLDRAFVRDMDTRKDLRDIVGAVTALAHQLGLEVIAEGVEDNEQLAQVRALDCEYVQGFFFSKPVDKERAAALLHSGFAPQSLDERPAAPGPEAASAGSVPGRKQVADRLRKLKPVYVAAAVVLTLALAGLVTRFASGPSAPGPAAPHPAVETAAPNATAPAAGLPAAAPPAGQPASAQAGRQPAPVADGSPSDRARERHVASAAKPEPAAARPATYAFSVLHKHAFRGCRGQLTVTRSGLAFVPDKGADKDDDGFTLGFNEFLYSLSGDELTIKSSAKAYRFKAADTSGQAASHARLQEVVDRIARLRGTSPAK